MVSLALPSKKAVWDLFGLIHKMVFPMMVFVLFRNSYCNAFILHHW